jgi:hypothetical protein
MRTIVIGMFLVIASMIGLTIYSDTVKHHAKASTDEWQQGDFVTYRRIYPHQRCGGQMVFNGKSERAPYSENDYFHTHVCDLCGTTNQILNATWPQYKREWRKQ